MERHDLKIRPSLLVEPTPERSGFGWQAEVKGVDAHSLDFHLPSALEAGEPPEERGLRRDQVRLMVSFRSNRQIIHTNFRQIVDFLLPGDALVINTSGTLNAALLATRTDQTELEFHLSTHLPGDLWSVELRRPTPAGSVPFLSAQSGEILRLPGGATVQLLIPYRPDQRTQETKQGRVRLWIAALAIPGELETYLEQFGFPIRYKYVRDSWPLEYYQNVYATEKGSAEMPSAGRAFTSQLITQLVAKGVHVLPMLLHTGVASLEEGEPPYEENYRVPAETAMTINQAHASGKHVIAVGTTVLRALETVTTLDGIVHPGEGLTRLVITPEHSIRSVDGLLTGLHEPRSSHLAMLLALAGFEHAQAAYAQALEHGYLWHEFGDLHLILP
jgi:S-adenosylmethionine:tRNA ribosyltransferase-isomerase